MNNNTTKNLIFSHITPTEYSEFMKTCFYIIPDYASAKTSYYSPYKFEDKELYIPYRLGYEKAEVAKPKTPVEEALALCLETRHHDGFRREIAVRKLFEKNYVSIFPFVIPYVIRVTGEYVIEISQYIYDHKEALSHSNLSAFKRENILFIQQNKERSISYWDDDYRDRISNYKDMPGVKFLNWIRHNL